MPAHITVLAALLLSTPTLLDVETLAAALRRAPAWRVEFVQRYLPAGLETATSETGTLLLAPPARLRFDYAGAQPRTFAVDGAVARLVEPVAGTCDALELDHGRWQQLPLAALLDPAAAREAFHVHPESGRLRLVPRQATVDIGEIVVAAKPGALPTAITVQDAAGNRNEFRLSRWSPIADPGFQPFQPHLPGQPPCAPPER